MEVIETLIPSNLKKTKDKKQIVLTHTSRNIFDYVTSLKLRFNGDPIKLPHYLVSRDGKVIRTIDDLTNSNFTINKVVNEKSIVICLENLGWLEKVLLKNHHTNWIGNIYKEKVLIVSGEITFFGNHIQIFSWKKRQNYVRSCVRNIK